MANLDAGKYFGARYIMTNFEMTSIKCRNRFR